MPGGFNAPLPPYSGDAGPHDHHDSDGHHDVPQHPSSHASGNSSGHPPLPALPSGGLPPLHPHPHSHPHPHAALPGGFGPPNNPSSNQGDNAPAMHNRNVLHKTNTNINWDDHGLIPEEKIKFDPSLHQSVKLEDLQLLGSKEGVIEGVDFLVLYWRGYYSYSHC